MRMLISCVTIPCISTLLIDIMIHHEWKVGCSNLWEVRTALPCCFYGCGFKLQTSQLKSGPPWMEKWYYMWRLTALLKEGGPHLSALDSCPGDILQVDSIFAWWVGHMEAQHLLPPQSNASSSHFLAIYRHYLNSWSSESRKLISAPVTQDFPGT